MEILQSWFSNTEMWDVFSKANPCLLKPVLHTVCLLNQLSSESISFIPCTSDLAGALCLCTLACYVFLSLLKRDDGSGGEKEHLLLKWNEEGETYCAEWRKLLVSLPFLIVWSKTCTGAFVKRRAHLSIMSFPGCDTIMVFLYSLLIFCCVLE